MSVVLDASAILAFVQGDDGADAVEAALDGKARCGGAAWSGVTQKVLAAGRDWQLVRACWSAMGSGPNPSWPTTPSGPHIAGGGAWDSRWRIACPWRSANVWTPSSSPPTRRGVELAERDRSASAVSTNVRARGSCGCMTEQPRRLPFRAQVPSPKRWTHPHKGLWTDPLAVTTSPVVTALAGGEPGRFLCAILPFRAALLCTESADGPGGLAGQ